MTDRVEDPLQTLSREEILSALFEQMIIQHTNLALMFLGRMPHPQSGQRIHDLQSAKLFIDQLEMLEFKTKGNLSRDEEKLLQQGLMHLRATFVETINKTLPAEETAKSDRSPPQPAGNPESAPPADAELNRRQKS